MLCGATLLLFGGRVAAAQKITVVPASAGPLQISTAVAGQQPVPVTVAGGTYTLRMKKKGGFTRITAQLARPLPAGTSLWVTLESPGGGAQSAGMIRLSTAPVDAVTNIPSTNKTYTGCSISYQFRATTAAGVVALRTARVTLALAP